MFIECAIWVALKALLGIKDDEITNMSMSPYGIVAFIERSGTLKEISIDEHHHEVYIYYEKFIHNSDITKLGELGIFTIHPIKETDGEDMDHWYRKPDVTDGMYIKMTWR